MSWILIRSELASSSKQQGPSNGGKFKWFHRLDALIKSQLFDDKDFESPQTELQNSECTPEQITLESDESITFLSCADQSPTFETHSMEATIEDFVPQPLFTDKSIKKLHKSHHRKRKRDHFAETSSQLKFLREELKQETSNSNDRLSKMHSSLDELRHFLQRVDGNLSNISSLLYQLVHNKPPVQTPVLPQSYKKFSSVMVMSPPQVVHRQYHQQHQRCYSQYLTRHELESQLDGSTEENGERSFLNL